jgi:hypothetical protein
MFHVILSIIMIAMVLIIFGQGLVAYVLLNGLRIGLHGNDPGQSVTAVGAIAGIAGLWPKLLNLRLFYVIVPLELSFHLVNGILNLRAAQRLYLPYFGILMLVSAGFWFATWAASLLMRRSLVRTAMSGIGGAPVDDAQAGVRTRIAAIKVFVILATAASMAGFIALLDSLYQSWSG